ncbi:ferredoxin [Rhodococcus sp. NPDC003348]
MAGDTAQDTVGTLSVAEGKCMGHGRCYAVAPDLLTDDEAGFVAQAGQDLPIGPDLLAQARDAADACPERAIAYRAS